MRLGEYADNCQEGDGCVGAAWEKHGRAVQHGSQSIEEALADRYEHRRKVWSISVPT